MIWQHLQAVIWLRRRLLANQWVRGGRLNAALMSVFGVAASLMAILLCVGAFALGMLAIPHTEPVHLLYAWDALVVAFLFFWGVGLLADLQRTEPLSLAKFLHLPVSIQGAFLINYLSSWVSLCLLVFVPVFVGFALALVWVGGLRQLIVFPLLAAFVLMVTAVTYQFQGWLASLMTNPRRRRAVVVGATVVLILLAQLPNLANMRRVENFHRRQTEQARQQAEEDSQLQRAVAQREIDVEEYQRRANEQMHERQRAAQEAFLETAAWWKNKTRLANVAVPFGWLPLGVMAAAEGNLLPGILGCMGLGSIGGFSLWRAYRTTLAMYRGAFTAGSSRAATSVARSRDVRPAVNRLEARLWGLSEPVAAVALAGFRSLVRAPEAKMMLLTPVIMILFFGSLLLNAPRDLPVAFRPLPALGAILFALMGLQGLMANQFGFDRDGFRVFVLSAVPRRDILLGKNLAFAPLALVMVVISAAAVQVMTPLRLDHLAALVPQFATMYLMFCLLMNLLSIYAPLPIAAGSLKPASLRMGAVFLHTAAIFVFFPVTQTPTLVPLAIEALLVQQGWTPGSPIWLVLALAECAAIIWLYLRALNWQGRLLQKREQRILETITNR